MSQQRSYWLTWATLVCVSVFVVVLPLLPPFVSEPWRHTLMHAFSMVCHQLPNRSPHIDGVSFAVCHRCLGVYTGLLIATFVFLVIRRWDGWIGNRLKVLLAIFALPLVIDWGLNYTPLPDNTPVSRMITGGMLGLALGYVAVRGILQAVQQPSAVELAREQDGERENGGMREVRDGKKQV